MKNAKFFKNNQYYCKIHAKKKNYKIPTTDLKQTSIKKKKIIDLKKLANRLQIKYHKKIKKKEIFELIQQHLQKHYFSFKPLLKISLCRESDMKTTFLSEFIKL